MALQPQMGQGLSFIIKLSRTPLEKWSARRRDLYLTTHNTENRRTSKPPEGIETAIAKIERPVTHASARAATDID